MSKSICIFGESGAGKTTSIRTLKPQETYYIDADKKGLSWRGWREQYSTENNNYFKCADATKIKAYVSNIAQKAPHIKNIIIDTINGVMITDEMKRSKEKGFDKWIDLATCIWDLIDVSTDFREDLTIVFMAHAQTERDDSGYEWTRVKTSGKKLDKIVLESKFTTVLLAKCVDGKYLFETQSKNSTAKSPMGAFEELEIENDLQFVINSLQDF